jgi:N-acetyl-anhydromuramyl-L-alanine amidase AmpD
MRTRLLLPVTITLTVFLSTFACVRCLYTRPGPMARPGEALTRCGDEIVVAGQLFHTGTRVVLWLDPKGYDAYRAAPVFAAPAAPTTASASRPVEERQRFNQRRCQDNELEAAVATEGWTLDNLRRQVNQFVIHYDVCGTSRQCFKVLQDMRTLSVPFMLDVDGTIYQTLDLKERAWHAGDANDRSVGIEIAHMGAYGKPEQIQRYYGTDAAGPYFILPASESGVLTSGFVPRPARNELICGEIHGRTLHQYDFTDEQYAALIKLTAALHRVLPGINLEVPRNADGSVRNNVLSPEELDAWSGLIGHCHITRGKIDPGPAFDWNRVLEGARRELN